MDSGLRIGRIFGIPVHLHPTWFVVFLLVVVGLWNQLGSEYPALSIFWRVGAVLLTTALLFGSVLLHEVGHCVLALHHRVGVRSISLFIFGGVAWMEQEANDPRAEFRIAVAGPAVSGLLGGVFLAIAGLFEPGSPGMALFRWLGVLNLGIAVFNLLPGFPLDGGRVLRAVLWARGRDPQAATRSAARVGQGIAYGLVALGALLAWENPVSGLWLAFIGWFVLTASIAHRRQASVEIALRGLVARDVMTADVPTVDAATPVARFADEQILHGDRWAIVVAGGQPRGLVTRTDVKRLPSAHWQTMTVAEIATPIDQVAMASPDLPLANVLHLFSQQRTNQIPIIEGAHITGFITRQDLLQALEAPRAAASALHP
ncbi:MAG: site-2 protease family protein [Myxococcales bacterium]|nr:site-2 protease family protein [Myxococcales bacterium]